MQDLNDMIETILQHNTRLILGDYILYKQHNQIRLFSSISEISIPYDKNDEEMQEFLSKYQDMIVREYNNIKASHNVSMRY